MADSLRQTAWHSLAAKDALDRLESSSQGLDSDEVQRRLDKFGLNQLKPPHRRGPLARLLFQFHNILIYILIVAGIATALLQHWIDAGVIFGVVVVNALIGFIQEGKAEKALEAISKMLSLQATVIRQGQRNTVPADQIVPGDVVVLRSGDKVPADIRLIEARDLRVDESMLTGESVPVDKSPEPVPPQAGLGDRACLAFSGTLVTGGHGLGATIATGDRTEIGKISEMVSLTQATDTPLIGQMNRFGRVLAVVILAMAALTFAVGIVTGQESVGVFLASVALAVAAIPEGLPAIMTIVLAIGVQRMARRNAIIRRLAAVDTLGAITVICSDKTGTLTRNEMTVTAIVTADTAYTVTGVGYAPDGDINHQENAVKLEEHPVLETLIRAGLLCNDSDLHAEDDQWRPAGDPMESALITLAIKADMDAQAERRLWHHLDTIPFESANRFMATLHRAPHSNELLVMVKGAPERVLEMCDRQATAAGHRDLDPMHWQTQAKAMAADGQRVLAVAIRPQDGTDRLDFNDVQSGLIMLGLLGIIDPPRDEAIRAVQQCHAAGIRVAMITGDHALTAGAIGRQLGIVDDKLFTVAGNDLDWMTDDELNDAANNCNVFARVSPEHKLRLVTAIQAGGQVVAMTGDGVNDAPALKRADVGIAMGMKGTEVTKEAAEMVLADDNFASIANAIEEGRTVYDNLRKAILFILPTNGGQASTIMVAILLGGMAGLPLTPVQVLWVNMITAVTLALALAFEPPEEDVMHRPPRDPKAGLLNLYFLWRIILVSAVMCAGTFGMFNYAIARGASEEFARTVAVNTLVMFEVFYLFNTRFLYETALSRKALLGSRPVLLAVGLVIIFQLLFTYLPLAQRLFGTAAITGWEWGMLVLVSSTVLFIVELENWVMRRSRRRRSM